MKPILILDSHPVQYKAPIYQELERIMPGRFHVIYYTDCSIRGHFDREFGTDVAWDMPLLEGYSYRVLGNERGTPLVGFRSLSSRGVYRLLCDEKPRAVLISQFLYEADIIALLSARWLRIRVAIRHETQDEAWRRCGSRKLARSLVYRILYSLVDRAFYIGELNREHLLRHGFRERQLARAPYCVRDPFASITQAEKHALRKKRRQQLGFEDTDFVVLFSGKLISKKNPGLIPRAVKRLPSELRSKTKVIFMGAGELEGSIRGMAAEMEEQIRYLGFVNQSEIVPNYLAADVLVLPSRRMGETWGLVVNEALHAGCAVIISDSVGCHTEFGSWERVRVIPQDDAEACAQALVQLSEYERSFDWCAGKMVRYSVGTAAECIASAFQGEGDAR